MQAVKMFTTAVCPYCVRAKQVLKARGVEQIEEIRIDTDPVQRQHMMEITGRQVRLTCAGVPTGVRYAYQQQDCTGFGGDRKSVV